MRWELSHKGLMSRNFAGDSARSILRLCSQVTPVYVHVLHNFLFAKYSKYLSSKYVTITAAEVV